MNKIHVTALAGLLAAFLVAGAQGALVNGIAYVSGSNTDGANGGGPGTNNYPGNENPANAIDGGNNKYLNFIGTDAAIANNSYGGLIVDTSAANSVTQFSFLAGNDSTDRDPLSINIYGSNTALATGLAPGAMIDVSGYQLIYSGASGLLADPGRNNAGATVTFPNANSFRTYEVLVTSMRGPGEGCCFQFDEIRLGNGTTPVVTSSTNTVYGVAVPEPTTMALIGIAGFAFLSRKRSA